MGWGDSLDGNCSYRLGDEAFQGQSSNVANDLLHSHGCRVSRGTLGYGVSSVRSHGQHGYLGLVSLRGIDVAPAEFQRANGHSTQRLSVNQATAPAGSQVNGSMVLITITIVSNTREDVR